MGWSWWAGPDGLVLVGTGWRGTSHSENNRHLARQQQRSLPESGAGGGGGGGGGGWTDGGWSDDRPSKKARLGSAPSATGDRAAAALLPPALSDPSFTPVPAAADERGDPSSLHTTRFPAVPSDND